ncbi:MAG: TonB-dependent receptor [Cyclobacteriaceae bacterium]
MQIIVSTIAIMTMVALPLLAQTEQDSIKTKVLEEVVISVTRSQTLSSDLPLTVGVVQKQQIEEFQPMTPVEAMQYQTAVIKQSDGGLASTPIIRGLSRERAPLLIDGNPFVGGRIRSYSLVDPYQIERIEIVKGPASAFWGSDAVSGLVNVVTRRAESGYGKEFQLGGSLYGGFQSANNHLRGRAELEGRGNGVDFLVGVGGRKASNTQTPDGEVENSQFETFNLDFNLGYSPKENHRIELSGKYIRNDDVGFPGGLGAPGPPIIDRRFAPDMQRALNLSYDGKNISDKVASIGARIFFKRQDLHINQTTNVFFEGTQNVNRKINAMLDVDVPFWGAKFFTSLRLGEKSKLTVGTDFLREHRIGTHRDLMINIFNPAGEMVNEILRPFTQIQPDSYSSSFGLFAIDEIIINDKLDLLLALRYDNIKTSIEDEPFDIPAIESIYNQNNIEDTDNALTGSFGIKYNATEDLSFFANVANSFRGTDLFSKYHFTAVGPGFLVPNPDLDPERGFFYELGGRFNNEKVYAELNFFQNRLKDLFVTQDITFDGTPSIQNQNIGEATLTGLEWQFRAKFSNQFNGFYQGSYIKGDNDVTNNPLPQIPALHHLVGLQYKEASGKFFAQLDAMIVGDQNDPAPNEVESPGYTVLNLNTGLNLNALNSSLPHAKVMFGITNIADESYRSHVSRGAPGNQRVFTEPGRSFNISLVVRFGAATLH